MSFPLASFTEPSHGTLALTENGAVLLYTSSSSYVGMDTFTFTATDQYGAMSNAAAIPINVYDYMPEAGPEMLFLPAFSDSASNTNGAYDFYSGPVSFRLGASDTDGDALTYSASQPTHGTLQLDSTTGDYTYTPNPGDHSTVIIPFTASDGAKTSNVSTVTIVGFQVDPNQTEQESYYDRYTYDPIPCPNKMPHEKILENQSLQVGTGAYSPAMPTATWLVLTRTSRA